jgi:hypothetical protein
LIYRLLERNEWELAKPLLTPFGGVLPEMGWISGAFDGDKLVAAHVLQPALHGEPVVIGEQYRGKVNFYKLQMPWKRALPKGTEYWVFSPDHKIARLAEGSGMEEVPWRIWKGRI